MDRRKFLGALSLGLVGLTLATSGIGGLLETVREDKQHGNIPNPEEGYQPEVHVSADDIRRYANIDVEAELYAIMEEEIHKDTEKELKEVLRRAGYSMI